jgi:hypothetical protein
MGTEPGSSHSNALEASGATDPTWARLEERINDYGKQSEANKRLYQYVKLAQIMAGAGVTFAGAAGAPRILTAGVGAAIVVLEGGQQLFRYHEQWLRFRTSCEALRREKFLFLAKVGHYSDGDAREKFAEQIETIVSREVDLFASQETAEKKG